MYKIEDMWQTPGTRPNGLQAADDGLWVISADDDSRLYKLDYDTGEAIVDVPTETYKSSGMTVGGGHVWIASPTPAAPPHGIAWDGETIWCADRVMQIIHRLNPCNGEILDEIYVPEPELHGLTLHDGALIFCCDSSNRVCRIEI